MDVLRPPVVWINGRCYRKLPFERNSNFDSTPDPYQEQEGMIYEDEVCDDLIEENNKGFKTVLDDIPRILYKFIIGRGGETKRRIEDDTNTRISIPAQGQTGYIVITGPHKAGVVSARSRVVVISESSRQKIPFTHFVSFPLYFDDLAERTMDFKESVLKELGQCKGIHPSIFQQPCHLHLTVGMLRLLDDSEVKKAAAFLSSCYKQLLRKCLSGKPVSTQLKGVQYMNDDPFNVHILYAKIIEPDGNERLQNLAESLVDKFVDYGIMEREYDRVKLHATIMNSSLHSDFAEPRAEADSWRRPKVPPSSKENFAFDARDIVELYKDFDFGTYHLREIHISKRGSFDSQGHYTSEISVPLP